MRSEQVASHDPDQHPDYRITDSRVRGPVRAVELCLRNPLVGGLAGVSAFAKEALSEDEEWPEMDLQARIAAVSDGELRFVGPERAARPHLSRESNPARRTAHCP